jgi:hypothetical protein
MLPLDGGHLLDEISRLGGAAMRPRWVGWVSIATGSGVALFAVSRGTMYGALLGALGAAQGYSRIRTAGTEGHAVRSCVQAVIRARDAIARGDVRAAASLLLPEARIGALGERELAELVDVLVKLGRIDELVALCRERLTAFARRDDSEPLARLAAEALADEDAHEHALAVSQVAFQQLNIPYYAYEASCHLVRLCRYDEAIEWLGRAIEARLDCGDTLLTDPAFDPLRDRADFREIVARGTAKSTMGRSG